MSTPWVSVFTPFTKKLMPTVPAAPPAIACSTESTGTPLPRNAVSTDAEVIALAADEAPRKVLDRTMRSRISIE